MYDREDLEDGLVKFHPVCGKLTWIMKDEEGDIPNIWTYRWEWSWGIRGHQLYEELP